jgi:hypothetical protein
MPVKHTGHSDGGLAGSNIEWCGEMEPPSVRGLLNTGLEVVKHLHPIFVESAAGLRPHPGSIGPGIWQLVVFGPERVACANPASARPDKDEIAW